MKKKESKPTKKKGTSKKPSKKTAKKFTTSNRKGLANMGTNERDLLAHLNPGPRRCEEDGSEGDSLKEALQFAWDKIAALDDELGRLFAAPMVHATVVKATNEMNPDVFHPDDLVLIIDNDHPLYKRTGRLVGPKPGQSCVDSKGYVQVMLPDLSRHNLAIGIHKKPQQIKLLGKNDGTNVILSAGGELQEVFGLPGHKFYPGNVVKVNLQSKQIVEPLGIPGSGSVAFVKTVIDQEHAEVEINGQRRIVYVLENVTLEAGDQVEMDRHDTVVVRRLARENQDQHTLKEEATISWDDIGGCEEAKTAMKEAIEDPYLHPDLYKFYNKRLPKGALLYGPPGCGKTLIGKASAHSLMKQFGKEWMHTGFILVKGPELLSMWVGMAEHNIRELFVRAKKHFKKTGCPAVIFIDEAEAILPVRGSGRSSDVEKTIVPMFLSEMDGVEEHNSTIIILATNRPEMLDPAAIRPGRIDRHVKVPRPTPQTAVEIFKIHMKGVPFYNVDIETASAMATAEIFSKNLTLYRIMSNASPNPKVFTLSDCLNGAIIANVVEQSVTLALKRDLRDNKRTGVSVGDIKEAITSVYRGQADQNHKFDLDEYCETNGICNPRIERTGATV